MSIQTIRKVQFIHCTLITLPIIQYNNSYKINKNTFESTMIFVEDIDIKPRHPHSLIVQNSYHRNDL